MRHAVLARALAVAAAWAVVLAIAPAALAGAPVGNEPAPDPFADGAQALIATVLRLLL